MSLRRRITSAGVASGLLNRGGVRDDYVRRRLEFFKGATQQTDDDSPDWAVRLASAPGVTPLREGIAARLKEALPEALDKVAPHARFRARVTRAEKWLEGWAMIVAAIGAPAFAWQRAAEGWSVIDWLGAFALAIVGAVAGVGVLIAIEEVVTPYSSRATAFITTSVVAVGVGAALWLLTLSETVLVGGAAGALIGIGSLFAAEVVVGALGDIARSVSTRRQFASYPRETMLDALIDVTAASFYAKPEKPSGLPETHLKGIETLANVLERDLLRRLILPDDQWAQDSMKLHLERAGAGVRHWKRHIVRPAADSPRRLREELEVLARAVVSEDWDALREREPDVIASTQRSRVRGAAIGLVRAVAAIAAYVALQVSPIELDAAVESYVAGVVVVWVIVNVLRAIDPSLIDPLKTAADVVGKLRP